MSKVRRRSLVGGVPVCLALALSALGVSAAPGVARSLPAGCNLDVTGQTVGVLVDRRGTFQFDGYNAVPPGHRVTGATIAWGDGTTSRATVTSHRGVAGCVVTVFGGRHEYRHVTCVGGVCSQIYPVTVRFRDAATHRSGSLSNLRVDVVRVTSPTKRPARH
jgi:hypothetical protein